MKKFYTLMLGLAAVLTASALTPGQAKFAPKVNALDGMAPQAAKVLNHKASTASTPALQVKSRDIEDAIYDPEGRAVDYTVTATRFVYGMWGLSYERGDYPGKIVWGDDNVVYIRDIISSLPAGIYVEGIYEDGKVTVPLPQVCYTEEGEMFYAAKMEYYTYIKEGQKYMSYRTVADDENFVVYDVDEEGNLNLTLNNGDPETTEYAPLYIIGVCYDPTENIDDWYGYGDSYQTYTAFNEEPVRVPEGVELEDWVMTSSDVNLICQVGFDGDDVYIVNCSEFMDDIAFKGTIDGDVVRFPVDQYLGQFDGYFIYLEAVEWTSDDWEEFEPLEEIVMTYDAERKIMAVDNPLVDIMYCTDKESYEPLEYFEDPAFLFQSEEDMNAAPENPYVSYFAPYEYREWFDTYEGYIEWMIPRVNVNGYLLDTDRMYYHFLVNGEVKTFTLEEYPNFEEEVTDLPYDFGDDFDLQVFDESHYFTFKSGDIETFGLQSFFIGTDDEIYASEIVTYKPKNDALESLNSAKEVKAVEFYNLQGQRVSVPTSGIYIMRTVCNDGTSTVRKVSK